MIDSINSLAAREHTDDLRRAAQRRWPTPSIPHPRVAEPASPPVVTVRIAGERDARAIHDLAGLDGKAVPDGDALLALIDGKPVAALSLDDGRVLANPFVHTQSAVELLRLRARLAFGDRSRRRWRPRLRPRFA